MAVWTGAYGGPRSHRSAAKQRTDSARKTCQNKNVYTINEYSIRKQKLHLQQFSEGAARKLAQVRQVGQKAS